MHEEKSDATTEAHPWISAVELVSPRSKGLARFQRFHEHFATDIMDEAAVRRKVEEDFLALHQDPTATVFEDRHDELQLSYDDYKQIVFDVSKAHIVDLVSLSPDQFGLSESHNGELLTEIAEDFVLFHADRIRVGDETLTDFEITFSPPEQLLRRVSEAVSEPRDEASYGGDLREYVKLLRQVFLTDSFDDSNFDWSWRGEFLGKLGSDADFADDVLSILLERNYYEKIKSSDRCYPISTKLNEAYQGRIVRHFSSLLSRGELSLRELLEGRYRLSYVRRMWRVFTQSLQGQLFGGKSDFVELSIDQRPVNQLVAGLVQRSTDILGNQISPVEWMWIVSHYLVELLNHECVDLRTVKRCNELSLHLRRLAVRRYVNGVYQSRLLSQRVTAKELTDEDSELREELIDRSGFITDDFLSGIVRSVEEQMSAKVGIHLKKLNRVGFGYLEVMKKELGDKSQTQDLIERLLHEYFSSLGVSEDFIDDANDRTISNEWIQQNLIRPYTENLSSSVPEETVLYVLLKGERLLRREPNVIRRRFPKLTVVGDLHSQFFTLTHILREVGFPSARNPYVFNGDYIDKASFPIEVLVTLLALKIAEPEAVFLTRGNHENEVNEALGFPAMVRSRHNEAVLDLFLKIFDALPLGVIMNDHCLIIHAGIGSERDFDLDYLQQIPRLDSEKIESRQWEVLIDVLWSDPVPRAGLVENKGRGVSWCFGPDVTERFLDRNDLRLIVRSHECLTEGCGESHDGKVLTVHSAPPSRAFKGAYLKLTAQLKHEFVIYDFIERNYLTLSHAQQLAKCCIVQ